MKLILFMFLAALSVMVVMIAQVVRQEVTRKSLKTSAQVKANEILRKEASIGEIKKVIEGYRPQLESLLKLTGELKAKKDNLQAEKTSLEEKVNTCNKEKGEVEQKKNEATENFGKLKNDHEEGKEAAKKTIENLKQQVLDHEKAICALVDTANAEARKLCGLGDAA